MLLLWQMLLFLDLVGWIFSQGLRCLHCCHGTHHRSCADSLLRQGQDRERKKERVRDFVFDNVVPVFDNEWAINQLNQILIPSHLPQVADIIIWINKNESLNIIGWFGETDFGFQFFWILAALGVFKTLPLQCK